jgi:hypothetical protein
MRCELVDASPSGRQRAGLHDGKHPSSENYLASGEVFACLLLGKSSFSYHFKTYLRAEEVHHRLYPDDHQRYEDQGPGHHLVARLEVAT